MSFYQRSLALFFGELTGPPVVVADAKDAVAGESVKGLRVTVQELGYVSLWYVKNRVWHSVRPGGAPQRSPVPSSAVIYQIGTEVVGDLLRISQDALLQPGGDKARIESYVRGYEGFLQHNIPQGLASLKAYDGVERARVLLDELRREYQTRLATGATAAAPAAAPAPAVEELAFPSPPAIVYDLDTADDDVDLTYDAESIAWPPPAEPIPAVAVPFVPDPLPSFDDLVAAQSFDAAPPAFETPLPAPVPAFDAAPVEPAPLPTPAPAAEPVTVVPQTTASYVFDQALVGLLGRLGTAYPWLLPDYGRHGDGMGVRVTLPAGFSVVFTHVGTDWTAYAAPEAAPTVTAQLDGDDAVVAWAIPRIRDFTAAYGARLGAERPADAAQLFQRVADLS